MIDEKNSLTYWFPKIEKLGILVPKTVIVPLTEKELHILYEEKVPLSVVEKIRKAAKDNEISYPFFLRTDLASGKHNWENSCFVQSPEKLPDNVLGVLIHNLLAGVFGLPFRVFVIREYIELDFRFRAFRGMPVAAERRYFIKNGKVLCHHPYWAEDAIAEARIHKPPLPENWRQLLRELNTESEEEISILTGYARKIARVFKGYWSVDFARARDGTWYLIDMAVGERSWHPLPCKYAGGK